MVGLASSAGTEIGDAICIASCIASFWSWRPFRLDLGVPLEEIDRLAYVTVRFGSWEPLLNLEAHAVAVDEPVGAAGISRDGRSRSEAVPA